MSLKESLKKSLDYSPKIQSAKAALESAKWEIREVRGAFFPQVNLIASERTFEISDTGFGFSGNFYETAISVSQSIYSGGLNFNNYHQKESSYQVQQYNFKNIKNTELSEVIDLYYDHFNSQKRLKILEISQELQNNFLKITKNKVRRGNAKNYELAQAKADFLSYESRLRDLVTQKLSLSKQLLQKMGSPLKDYNFETQENLEEKKKQSLEILQKDVNYYVQQALLYRPDLLNSKESIGVAEHSRALDLSSDYPTLSVSAQYGYQSTDRENLIDDRNEQYSTVINLTIPIFSGLSSIYKRRKGTENIKQAKKNYRHFEDRVRIEVQTAYWNLKTSFDNLGSSTEWSSEANRAIRQAMQSFRVGTIDSLQLMQVQSSRERADLALLDSEIQFYKNLKNFLVAIGFDISTY